MAEEKAKMGRPVKYESAEVVQEIIDQYFETDAFIESGDKKIYSPTMSGLAFALNLSRQGLLDYSNKENFFDTIRKARQKVEISLEQKLSLAAVAGTIFNLKNNFGWRDKTEQELTGKDGAPLYIPVIKRFDGSIDEDE